MSKFMYWLWGVAEDREFRGGLMEPFWSWLTRVCDRYHGYKHDADGFIVQDPSVTQGGDGGSSI